MIYRAPMICQACGHGEDSRNEAVQATQELLQINGAITGRQAITMEDEKVIQRVSTGVGRSQKSVFNYSAGTAK